MGIAVQSALANFGDPAEILRDVMGNKSPRTVNKRASTLLALFAWMDKCKIKLWPLGPERVTTYLSQTVVAGQGSTKGKSLLEAFRFASVS